MSTLGKIISGDEDGERNTDGSFNGGSNSVESGANGVEDSTKERISEPERLGGFEAIKPIEFGTGPTEPAKRKRGRPPGSGAKTGDAPRSTPIASATFNKQTPSNLSDLDGLILSAHLMVAKMLSVPEMELTEKESEKLADSVRNVAKYYTTVFDPKKIAIFELCCAAGSIYGPRAVSIYKRTGAAPRPQLVKRETPAAEPEPKPRPLSELSPSELWGEGG